jgi:hypothetical protein
MDGVKTFSLAAALALLLIVGEASSTKAFRETDSHLKSVKSG